MSIRLNNLYKDSTIKDAVEDVDVLPVGAFGIASNYALYEPQRTNHFEFRVDSNKLKEKLNGLISYNTNAEKEAGRILTVSTISAPDFSYTISKVDVSRGNTTIHFAGKPEYSGDSFTFTDYIGAGTKDILLAWQSLAFNVDTEKVGLADDYKMEAYVTEYTPDHQKVREWKLYGVWVSQVSSDGHSVENSDKIRVTARIYYDYFKVAYDVADVVR